ncbi:MAG: T9SS type A sorting domain-containing protein, partial [Candidatus Neomarinimicrobiota bacterium]|nr:T9SS type A sorting domain-containing protein [Candidatus Neomarinimicrobiota bacterium]
ALDEDALTWNVVWWETDWMAGDTVKFKYANPIQIGQDEFTWSTTKGSTGTSDDVANVQVYPNPYYGFHELETSRNNKFVSFNHLPTTATIDIYTLGGTFVKSIEKTDDGSQFARWDLRNQYGYPVASGLYIVRVSSGGNEKILKLALVQETQVLKYY